MTTREDIVASAHHITTDYARLVAGRCDEASFEDRIDQMAADIGKYRGENYAEAIRILSGIVAAYDAGGEDDPTAPDVTDSLMDAARELLAARHD